MMKTDRKTKYVIAGILFFLLAVWNAYQAYANIRQIMLVMSHYFYPRLFLPVVYNIVLVFFSILFGCWALKQRERGKAWDIVGLLYLLYLLFNLVRGLIYGHFTILGLAFVLVLALALSLSADSVSALFHVKDTASEAAKMKDQQDKQDDIYKEQLKSGILTREEYDQIMKARKR